MRHLNECIYRNGYKPDVECGCTAEPEVSELLAEIGELREACLRARIFIRKKWEETNWVTKTESEMELMLHNALASTAKYVPTHGEGKL